MRHKIAGKKLGRPSGHRILMFRNMVTDLLNYEQITTTETKAKEVRGLAEKMITLGKKGGLHSRRQASSFIMSENVAAKVFKDLAPRYAQREGGYTRITKLGPRLGDGASMVKLELVK